MTAFKVQCFHLFKNFGVEQFVSMPLSKVIYMKLRELLHMDFTFKIAVNDQPVYLAVGEALTYLVKEGKNAHSLIKVLNKIRNDMYRSEIDVKDFLDWDLQKVKLMKTLIEEFPQIQDLKYEIDQDFDYNFLNNKYKREMA